MNTDQICETLGDRAIKREKTKLERASAQYNKEIGLAGGCAKVTLKCDDGSEVTILTTKIWPAITDALIKKRSDSLKATEVRDFLQSVESFQSNIHGLQEYLDSQ